MNKKLQELNRIIDTVVKCCALEIDDIGKVSLTRKDVLGKCRKINVIMTRCLLVGKMIARGFSIDTVSAILNRSAAAVRYMVKLGRNFKKTSLAYNIALKEIDDKLND